MGRRTHTSVIGAKARLAVALLLAAVAALAASACDSDGGGSETPAGGDEAATPTGALPTPRPDGEPQGHIAWVSFRDGDREIYAINADGSGLVNVTNSPDSEDLDADWSPDGSQLVFTSDRDGASQLYTMNADGSDVHPLTFDQGGSLSPKWSPDGKQIAFSRTGTLKVINANGTGLRTLLETESESTAEPCRGGAFLGDWSPDSKRITYYSASVTRGIGQVCIIDADGSNIEVVVSEPPEFHVEPAWSPDGKTIAYRRITSGNSEVFLVDLETKELTNLTNYPELDVEPAWSPDGEWIAFASIRDAANFDIFIMRKDGSDVRRLASHLRKDSYPFWGP